MTTPITIQTTITLPPEKVWEYWTGPEHIVKWAFASDDWEAPRAENDVRVGGRFVTVMAAKDGGTSFDFSGVYTVVVPAERLEYEMGDGRNVTVQFERVEGGTKVTQTFDPEDTNPIEMQRAGWQSILDNFKKYAESQAA